MISKCPLMALNMEGSVMDQTGTSKQLSVKPLMANFKEMCPVTQVPIPGHRQTDTQTQPLNNSFLLRKECLKEIPDEWHRLAPVATTLTHSSI
jgi:hypothetical protein